METHTRTIWKSLTWRIIAIIATIVSIGVVTGDWNVALAAGVVANMVKAVLYYMHERAWARSTFGIK